MKHCIFNPLTFSAERVVARLLKILARNPDIKFGGNLKTEVPILYYHYPSAPLIPTALT